MKTVAIGNARFGTTYRTNSGMRTIASFFGRLYKQGLRCDVYDIEDTKHIALVLSSIKGDLLNSTTIITIKEYEAILDLHEPTAGGRYHTALLEKCGAINHLELR